MEIMRLKWILQVTTMNLISKCGCSFITVMGAKLRFKLNIAGKMKNRRRNMIECQMCKV